MLLVKQIYGRCLLKAAYKHLKSKQVAHVSSFVKWYRNLWQSDKPPIPPYSHICQLGDPVLRYKAEEVPPESIKKPEIQKVIKALKQALKHYKAVGLSAPQIGVPLRIMLVEFSEKTLLKFAPEIRASYEMEVCPSTIVINPVLQILNPHKVVFTEGCSSVAGFSASVARHHEVALSGLNEDAEDIHWQVKGWLARIVQHEMDHLEGIVLTDVMDPKTLQYDYWYSVNLSRGRVRSKFN